MLRNLRSFVAVRKLLRPIKGSATVRAFSSITPKDDEDSEKMPYVLLNTDRLVPPVTTKDVNLAGTIDYFERDTGYDLIKKLYIDLLTAAVEGDEV